MMAHVNNELAMWNSMLAHVNGALAHVKQHAGPREKACWPM